MKWRCTWCGKPHESNDPPCDSCGHGQFEEAIVREREFETVDTGTQYLWVCANCGRQHVKNNPPCSRCGSYGLEKTEQTDDEFADELDVPSWLEVARPYAPLVLVGVAIVALFATGVLPLSLLLPEDGPPAPPDAPGDGSVAAGIDLEEVEREVHERLDAERRNRDAAERTYDDGVAGIAEYANRQNVVEYYEGTRPDDPDWNAFEPSCSGRSIVPGSLEPFGDVEEYDDEATLADDVANRLVSEHERLVVDDHESEGLDVHVVDGRIFVLYAAC